VFYLNCSRCLLSVRVLAEDLAMEYCPRCRARAGVLVPLFRSSLSVRALSGDRHSEADPG